MDLTPADIKLLLTALQELKFDQAEITVGEVRIAISRGGAPLRSTTTESAPSPAADTVPAPTAARPTVDSAASASTPPASATSDSSTGSGHILTSPSVGVFWRSPEPGAAPYVEVGQEVAVGDTIGIVEVMKLMNNISADVAGVVTAVHVDNAGAVEFGTALITIEPKS